MYRVFNNYNLIELIGINILNIGFVSVINIFDKLPIVISVLVGLSILTLNVIKIIKELKK